MSISEDLWLAFDFETSSTNRYTCKLDRVVAGLFSLGTKRVDWFEHDFRKSPSMRGSPLTSWFTDPTVNKVAHNLDYDSFLVCERLGIMLRGDWHDTYLMAKHVRNDWPSYSLKALAWQEFGETYPELLALRQWFLDQQLAHKGDEDADEWTFDMTLPPSNLVSAYCRKDVATTIRLVRYWWDEVKDNPSYEIDRNTVHLVSEAQSKGFKLDLDWLRDFKRRAERRAKTNRGKAAVKLGAGDKNPVGNHLRDVLKSKGEFRRTEKGQVKANDNVLQDWRKTLPGIDNVLRVRADEKLVSTYIDNFLDGQVHGIIHPNLIQCGAITRRFRARRYYSDSGKVVKGNAQNIPPVIREGIIAPPGFGVAKLDLASIEARLGAHLMSVMLGFDEFAQRYREDPTFNLYLYVIEKYTSHGKVTKKDPLYAAYKQGCLAIQYGAGSQKFAQSMVEEFRLSYSEDDCHAIYNNINRSCPMFKALQRAVTSLVENQGYIMDDFGSVYYLPSEERYKGVNAYCQGCAGVILKWWWIEADLVRRKTEPLDYFWNTVHDELDMALWMKGRPKARLQSYADVLKALDLFTVPIVAEVKGPGKNWLEVS